MPGDDNYFSAPLKKAVEDGQVPQARLDDMVHRILRSMFAAGVVDNPPVRTVVDPFRGRDDAQHIAEESIVLLKNSEQHSSAEGLRHTAPSRIIGSHADVGVLSGGGSAQVDCARRQRCRSHQPGGSIWGKPIYFPSSPLKNIQAKSPQATVKYIDGDGHRRSGEARQGLRHRHRLRQSAHARRTWTPPLSRCLTIRTRWSKP